MHFHCCCVISVIAISANSRGKLKMRSMLSVKWWASTGLAKKHITLTNCLVPQACLGNVYHSGQFVSFFCCNWSQYAKRTWGERRQPSWPCEHYRFPSVCMALGTVATQYVAHHTSYSCVNDINVSINVNASLQLAIQSPQFLTFMNVSLTMTMSILLTWTKGCLPQCFWTNELKMLYNL